MPSDNDHGPTATRDPEYIALSIIESVKIRQEWGYTLTNVAEDTGVSEPEVRRWMKTEKLETYTFARLMHLRDKITNADGDFDSIDELVSSTYARMLDNAVPNVNSESEELTWTVNVSRFDILRGIGRMYDYNVIYVGLPGLPVWVEEIPPDYVADIGFHHK